MNSHASRTGHHNTIAIGNCLGAKRERLRLPTTLRRPSERAVDLFLDICAKSKKAFPIKYPNHAMTCERKEGIRLSMLTQKTEMARPSRADAATYVAILS